ncbi:flagellar filament capping protein FliD [Campylobacter devanensis]|uniref:flagellar filament capping protein FliD n=1 Tax=Campylobacter devanensis TaxID=3161138 RepID=UPI000A32E052|nr:flagellar filament capping protein FliD [Campylobacter sp. P0132]
MAINTEKSQLGVGSGNILSWDTIDKLKEADTKALVKPLETKIQDNLTKQKDLTAITTLLSTFKANVSNLTSDNTYLRRDANATGSGSVSVTANAGVAEQNMSLSVQQLATHDSYQSKTFDLRNGTVFDKDVSFGISIGGKDYVINADSSITLEGLAEKINEATEGKVQAKILNVGGAAGAESYRLVIQSAETGSDNAMSFYAITSGTSGGASHTSTDSTLEALGFYFDKANTTGTNTDSHGNTIQRLTLKKPDDIKDKGDNVGSQLDVAKDAKFKYNGIDITRSSNKVEDLILGVSLTLNKVDKAGESTNVNITQNTDGILEDIQAMVKSYNSLINNINEATKYDSETGLAGTFQGVREITSITTELNKIINGVSKDGKSLADFGITLTKDGILTLDSSVLNDMINTKFDEFKSFFSSETKFTNVTAKGDKAINWGDEIKGTLTINGVDISINIPKDYTAGGTTSTGGTGDEKDKKNALLKAIANASGLSDISASFDKDGKLVLKGSGGIDIEIKGNSDFLTKLGLKEQKLDGKTEIIGGFFKGLNDTINGLIGTNGTLTTYEENLTNSHKSLTESKEQRQKELDTKYTTMAEKWSQYDTIIAKLESQMNTVNGMIEAARNANK